MKKREEKNDDNDENFEILKWFTSEFRRCIKRYEPHTNQIFILTILLPFKIDDSI